MIFEFITIFIIPVLLSLAVTPWVIKFALHINAVDAPGGRKIHSKVTPRLGGIAILISIVCSLLILFILFPALFNDLQDHPLRLGIIGACFGAVFLLGFWDDLTPLKPGLKFGIQFIIAGLIYFAGFKISNITNPIGTGMLNVEMIDFPLTVIWIVGITNAFNLIDGLDGLASGVATIACISIFTVSALAGEIITAVSALVMAGALVGFLRYNFSPANIFLGDSGSLIIGFGLAILSIHSTTKISTGFALLFPMLVLGLPIADTLISMLRRFLGGFLPEQESQEQQSIRGKIYRMFTPDSAHIHHQLLSLGLTHRNTVILLYVVSSCFAIAAFATTQINTFKPFIILSFLLIGALFVGIKKLRYREIAIFNNGIMLPFYERWILSRITFLSLIDLTFIALSFSLSYKLIHSINPASIGFMQFEKTLIIILSLQLFTFWASGLYRETIKQMGIGNALRITGSVTYAVILTAIVLFVADIFPLESGIQFLLLDFYFLLTCTLGIRIAYQVFSYWFHKDKKTGENVLIYGANESGTMILHKITNSPRTNFKIVGFLDDNPHLEGKYIYGYPILGGHWKLMKILQTMKVDYILICEDDIKPENFNRLKTQAHTKGVKIKRLQIRLKNILPESTDQNSILSHINEQSITYI